MLQQINKDASKERISRLSMEESEDDSKSAMVINDQLHQSKITKRSDPNKTESSFISNLVGSV